MSEIRPQDEDDEPVDSEAETVRIEVPPNHCLDCYLSDDDCLCPEGPSYDPDAWDPYD